MPRDAAQLIKYQFKKGNPGGPGRKPSKSLKEYARAFLANMSEKERLKYLNALDPMEVWRMAEGNPHNTEDLTSGGKPIKIAEVLAFLQIGEKQRNITPVEASEKPELIDST